MHSNPDLSAQNAVVTAYLCLSCANDLEDTHVMRNIGGIRIAPCERCGKKTATLRYQYIMKWRELKKRGLV